MSNTLNQKRNWVKQQKDIGKQVTTVKRINFLTTFGAQDVFLWNCPFCFWTVRGISHAGQPCSLVHSLDKNDFLTLPQCLTLQYLLAGSIWLFTLRMQFSSYVLIFLFELAGGFGTKVMALWYSALIMILLNHKYSHLKYSKISIWREKTLLLFVCVHVELLIGHICFLQNAVSSMMIALPSYFRKVLFCCSLGTIWEVFVVSSISLLLSGCSLLSDILLCSLYTQLRGGCDCFYSAFPFTFPTLASGCYCWDL